MQLQDFSVRPCRGSAALEFIPKKKPSGGLSGVSEGLRLKGAEVGMETPFVVVAKFGGIEFSFYKSGKIIVKGERDEAKARLALENLLLKK